MKRYRVLLIILFFIVLTGCGTYKNQQPEIKHGKIDLRNYDLNNLVVNLNGDWEYYEYELITPDDMKNKINIKNPDYINIPVDPKVNLSKNPAHPEKFQE